MTPSERKRYKRFWKRAAALKRDFPVDLAVSIRTVPYKTLKDENGCRIRGQCIFYDDNISVRLLIERHTDVSTMIDVLWHEWTHIRHGMPQRKDHPLEFWKEHGRIANFYNDEQKD